MPSKSPKTIAWLNDDIVNFDWRDKLKTENVELWVTTSETLKVPPKYDLIRLKDLRDHYHRTRVMELVDQWLNQSKDQSLNKWIEIIRYDLFFNFIKWETPYYYLSKWLEDFGSIRIIWLSSTFKSEELISWSEASTFFPGVQFELISARATNGVVGRKKFELKNSLFNRLSLSKEILTNSLKSTPVLPPGKILALEYYVNNLHTLFDVERVWNKESGDSFNWVAMRPVTQAEILNKNKGKAMIWNWLSPLDVIRLFFKSSKREFKSLIQVIGHDKKTPHYWKNGPLTKRFRTEFLKNMRLAKHYHLGLQVLMKQVNPLAVIGTIYSNIPGRALAQVSSNVGIKSVYFQHGVIQPFMVNTYILHQYMVLWGKRDAEFFIKRGISKDRIVISGPMSYDQELKTKPFNTFNKIPTSDFHVVYMASRTGGMWVNRSVARDTLQLLINALDYSPGMKLTIKKHPGDLTGLIEKMVEDQNSDRIQLSEKTSKEVIASADVVVFVSSTTGIEACIFGKPVINLNLTGIQDFSSLAQSKAAYAITESALFQEQWLEFLRSEELQFELYKNRMQVLDSLVNAGGNPPSEVIVKLLSELN